jgi:glycosyltransferase involved in cell wall biosynthesis
MNNNEPDITHQNSYKTEDIAIIIPTKDRPEEVKRLLQSIASLDCKVCRIIIVASGQDIQDVVMAFKPFLPVEYYTCEPGQIRQRNKGISMLDDSTRLVATMDDDAVFDKTAITEMIKFWNNAEHDTAGVGFNVVNRSGHRHTWLRGFLGVSVPEFGRILKSGVNTAISNVKDSIRSQWLNGGATVWKQEILKTCFHREIRSRWAICEDLIFSYPLGKERPLYVCHGAKIEVEDVTIKNETPELYRYRGKSQFLWGLYFVLNNKELSVNSFLRYEIMKLLGITIQGIIFRDYRKIQRSIGIISALYLSFDLLLKKNNIVNILESNT